LYHDKFAEICVNHGTPLPPGFNVNELKERFHSAKIFGLVCAVTSLPYMFKEDEDEAVDLEKSESDRDMMNMMKKASAGVSETNNGYRDRIFEVFQEMYDEGVI
jgi:hypothetical protein